MNIKFTSDGRKVVVVGSLNAKETIVQEIFVTNGTEFPAGEHFVVKTLLDAPAVTYKADEEKRILEDIKKLEAERERLKSIVAGFNFKANAVMAKLKWISGITDTEIQEVFDNIKAMICGEFTHVVFIGRVEIKEWDHKLFTRTDDHGWRGFESLQLLSLFGNWNGRLSLGWKANTYQDGSGGSSTIYPCRSLQEAVQKAQEIIYAKERLSDEDYDFCLKYSIPVQQEKNAVRLANKTAYIEKQIADGKERIAKLEADLKAVGDNK